MGQKIYPYSSASPALQRSLPILQRQHSCIPARPRFLMFTSAQLLIRSWLWWLEVSVWWRAHVCAPYHIWDALFQVKKAWLDQTVLSSGSTEEQLQKMTLLPLNIASVCYINNNPINTAEHPLMHTLSTWMYVQKTKKPISQTHMSIFLQHLGQRIHIFKPRLRHEELIERGAWIMMWMVVRPSWTYFSCSREPSREGSADIEWSFIWAVTHHAASHSGVCACFPRHTHTHTSTKVTIVDKHTAL